MTPRRKLGNLEVSALGLGCMSMTPIYGDPDPASAIATIHRAAELGIDFIDTSDAYGHGKNEELVAKAIAGRRDRYVIATKFGNLRRPDGSATVDGRPEYVRQACDASLKRLGIETIDLYYIHRIDPTVPIEDTVGAMAELVRAGKVRHIGLSEAGPRTLRRAHATHPVAALQNEYSLWTRDVEAEMLPLCKELGIGLVAYSPLGRGFLTGTIDGTSRVEQQGPALGDAPLPGRQPRAQPAHGLGAAAHRGRPSLHAGAARARLGVLARRVRRADRRHEPRALARAERAGARYPARCRHRAGARSCIPAGRHRRNAVS